MHARGGLDDKLLAHECVCAERSMKRVLRAKACVRTLQSIRRFDDARLARGRFDDARLARANAYAFSPHACERFDDMLLA